MIENLGLSVRIGVRLAETELRRLDEMARRTRRNRSQVVRLLLDQAELGAPDIRRRGPRSVGRDPSLERTVSTCSSPKDVE